MVSNKGGNQQKFISANRRPEQWVEMVSFLEVVDLVTGKEFPPLPGLGLHLTPP